MSDTTRSNNGAISASDRSAEFVRLLSEHDRSIFLMILSLVPHWADAEEIRQETNVRLWLEFERFEPGTDFGAWARTVARYQVLAFFERTHRDRLRLGRPLADLVAADVEATVDQAKSRQTVLAECVEELGEMGRELVRLHYTVGRKIIEIARDLGRTPDAVYKTLQRARTDLRRCVDRKLGEGEKS